MASDIGFSGPGAPDLTPRGKGGKGQVAVPEFVKRDIKAPEDEISMSTVETPRERAVRADAAEALGQSNASAPKV